MVGFVKGQRVLLTLAFNPAKPLSSPLSSCSLESSFEGKIKTEFQVKKIKYLVGEKRLTLIHTHSPNNQKPCPSSQTHQKFFVFVCDADRSLQCRNLQLIKIQRVNEGIYVLWGAPLYKHRPHPNTDFPAQAKCKEILY